MRTACLLLLVVTTRLALGGDEPPTFEIDRPGTEGRHERVRADVAEGRATFVVDRRADIDRALVRRTGGDWPKVVVVRFENFRSLEGFKVSNGTIRAEARLGFDEKRSPDSVPTYDAKIPGDAKPIGRAKVVVNRVGPHIEVTLPATLLPEGEAGLRLDWVDAYR